MKETQPQSGMVAIVPDEITTTYCTIMFYLSLLARGVNSCDVSCGHNEGCAKKGQVWSFIAVNNGYV